MYNFSWLFNVYCSSSLLSESFGAVDKTSSSFSAHGKIGNFIIIIIIDTAQRSHSMFSNGSEWITFADLGTELQ